jgi:hypothetical protein
MMRRIVFNGLLVLAAAGCGGSPQKTYPVSGVVKWSDGQPATELANANISLDVVEGKVLRGPRGQVKEDGTFILQTFEPGDGAPEGKYRAIFVPEMIRDDEAPRPKLIMDPRFQDYKKSGLLITVKPEPNNQVQLTVTRTKR